MNKDNKLIGVITPEGQISGTLRDNEMKVEVSISETGATGPQGPTGRSAYEHWLDQGHVGSLEDFLRSLQSTEARSYIHKQTVAADVWLIEHDLNKHPSATIVDSANSVVYGNIDYIDRNTLKVSFIGAFSGKAYLN